jgi:hypothetical protein
MLIFARLVDSLLDLKISLIGNEKKEGVRRPEVD